jgi:cytochrome c-type biogenesis protein
MTDVTIGLAFFAGILSFVSPCVLPLIPAYISYLTARAAQTTTADLAVATAGSGNLVTRNRFAVFMHGLAFVLGFTVVFVLFGFLIYGGSMLLRQNSAAVQDTIAKVGGVLVIVFGLHLLGLTNWLAKQPVWDRLGAPGKAIKGALTWLQSLLYGDSRRQMNPRSPYGYLGSSLMGIIFAAGWSPCLGPILTSILAVVASAATTNSYSQALVLMVAYSLGLGMPFLLAAIALDNMRSLMKRVQKRMRIVELVSGVFLILVGYLLVTGELTRLSQAGSGLTQFSYNLEGCGRLLWDDKIGLGDFGACMQTGPTQDTSVGGPGVVNIAASSAGNGQTGLDVGNLAPDFTVETLTGDTLTLSSLRGRVVLLNFWATWCAPCNAEMPDFEKLTKRYSPDDFTVLAINFMETPEQITPFMRQYGLTFEIGLDPDGKINTSQYLVRGYPTSYLINRDGVIVARQAGVFESEVLAETVRQAVGR